MQVGPTQWVPLTQASFTYPQNSMPGSLGYNHKAACFFCFKSRLICCGKMCHINFFWVTIVHVWEHCCRSCSRLAGPSMGCKEAESTSEPQQLAFHQMHDPSPPLTTTLSAVRLECLESFGVDLEGSIREAGAQLAELLTTPGEHALSSETPLVIPLEMTGFTFCHAEVHKMTGFF
jgi:hypothetical protein